MFYSIYINGEKIGTYGHDHVENLMVSVSADSASAHLMAGAVCSEGDKQFHYQWLVEAIKPTDEVRIVPAEPSEVPKPIKKYEMGRAKRKAREENLCEFCQKNETEVEQLIPGDENRPGICSVCVELCAHILSSKDHNNSNS